MGTKVATDEEYAESPGRQPGRQIKATAQAERRITADKFTVWWASASGKGKDGRRDDCARLGDRDRDREVNHACLALSRLLTELAGDEWVEPSRVSEHPVDLDHDLAPHTQPAPPPVAEAAQRPAAAQPLDLKRATGVEQHTRLPTRSNRVRQGRRLGLELSVSSSGTVQDTLRRFQKISEV